MAMRFDIEQADQWGSAFDQVVRQSSFSCPVGCSEHAGQVAAGGMPRHIYFGSVAVELSRMFVNLYDGTTHLFDDVGNADFGAQIVIDGNNGCASRYHRAGDVAVYMLVE